MNRKAQVSIFIVLGIVMLSAALFMFYVSRYSSLMSTRQEQFASFNAEYNSFYRYTGECLEIAGEEAVNSFDDAILIEQYMKLNSARCFNDTLFSAVDIEITAPFSLEIIEMEETFHFEVLLPTRISLGEMSREIDRYSFTVPKQGIAAGEAVINLDGNEFSIVPPVPEIEKEPFVIGEMIVSYHELPDDIEEYNQLIESLPIIEREFIYDDSMLDLSMFDADMQEIVASMMLDEKMVFNESMMAFEELKEQLIAFDFVKDVNRNKNSYASRSRLLELILAEEYSQNDEFFRYQWYLDNRGQFFGRPGADISIEGAWNLTMGDESAIIAVLDQGIFDNSDITPNIIYGKSRNFIEGNNDIFPKSKDEYHGTHVSGVIASGTNNQMGIAGICPKCRIINMRIADAEGGVDTRTLVNAMLLSVANGAKIVSMSLGGTYYSSYEANAVKKLSDKGIVFVAAAGNEGRNEKNYPAAYEGVIAVAASDNTDRIASFSNYGPWIDITAPGELILSACGERIYCFSSGTSMATPVVSGVIGLMKSIYPGASPARIKQIIQESADPIIRGKRINAMKALQRVSGLERAPVSERREPRTHVDVQRIQAARERLKEARHQEGLDEGTINEVEGVLESARFFQEVVDYCKRNLDKCDYYCRNVNATLSICYALELLRYQ
jgi:hypothetical protein